MSVSLPIEITGENHFPKKSGKEAYPIYSEKYNELIRFILARFPALNTLAVNTINESTAGSGVTIDSVLIKDGGLTVSSEVVGANTTTGLFINNVRGEAITAAGALSPAIYHTTINPTGGTAYTLADGTQVGTIKKIMQIGSSGVGILTPANLDTYTTVTFNNVGDTVELCWDGTNWIAVAVYNITTGMGGATLA